MTLQRRHIVVGAALALAAVTAATMLAHSIGARQPKDRCPAQRIAPVVLVARVHSKSDCAYR